jgi:hypothetical protein
MFKFIWESIKIGFSIWYIVIGIIFSALTFIGHFLPKMKMSNQIRKISLITLGILLALLILIKGTYNTFKNKNDECDTLKYQNSELQKNIQSQSPKEEFATPNELLGNYIKDLDVRITDLTRESIIIKNKVFENCRLYGPAVMHLVNRSGVVGCTFNTGFNTDKVDKEKYVSSIYIPVPTGAEYVNGVIVLDNVEFRNCSFNRIAFMGYPELRSALLKSLR